jgi:translation initiation factor 4A
MNKQKYNKNEGDSCDDYDGNQNNGDFPSLDDSKSSNNRSENQYGDNDRQGGNQYGDNDRRGGNQYGDNDRRGGNQYGDNDRRGGGRDDRRDRRDNFNDRRGGGRGDYDRDRHHGRDRGEYDRRDNRGDRDGNRGGDREYDRRDNHGGDNRRDNRGGDNRRDNYDDRRGGNYRDRDNRQQDREEEYEEIEGDEVESFTSFDDMDLNENILRGIYGYGFEKPSPIQQKAIVPLTKQNDVIGQAQSGTGKTGTFTIGTLQNIDTVSEKVRDEVQSIILAPTKELADQIASVAEGIATYSDIRILKLTGGNSKTKPGESITDVHRNDIRKMKPHLIVGTPGKIKDLLERRIIFPGFISRLVIDEADEMLSYGFQDQIFAIFKKMPSNVFVGLFSATMPQPMLRFSQKFMRNPIKILVKAEELSLDGISQYFVDVSKDEWKFKTLCELYEHISVSQCIIYCNKIARDRRDRDNCDGVVELTDRLSNEGFTVSCIHSKMTGEERTEIMRSFRKGETRVLISTDLTARGIDVQQVSLVINYDLPKSIENYIHRIGRSGRYGRKGIAINFETYYDTDKHKRLEETYGVKINALPSNIGDLID